MIIYIESSIDVIKFRKLNRNDVKSFLFNFLFLIPSDRESKKKCFEKPFQKRLFCIDDEHIMDSLSGKWNC